MHKLTLEHVGPIEYCELECTQFMTLTGSQASGKSTLAKAVFYFRTIKEDIMELANRQAWDKTPVEGVDDDYYDVGYKMELEKGLEKYLREKFFRTFGSLWRRTDKICMKYQFTETCSVKISLENEGKYAAPKDVCVEFSNELKRFLQDRNRCFSITPLGVPEEESRKFKIELCKIFDDEYTVVYIPAGRSMITLLSQQVGYIYATMDDMQKRSLDSCTQDYLERILRLRSEFSDGLQGIAAYSEGKVSISPKLVMQSLNLIKKILRGTYRYSNGEEHIVLEDGELVKINFSSSGQQESVWILNLLFYYLLNQKKVLFIIEEPESHLFPESQKYITELIALISNNKHSVILTTHSPYVLGTLNNLLYANSISSCLSEEVDKVIPESLWMDFGKFDAWFVKNGVVENCMDLEICMIQNERIDEISKVINSDFDRLLELQETEKEGVVI